MGLGWLQSWVCRFALVGWDYGQHLSASEPLRLLRARWKAGRQTWGQPRLYNMLASDPSVHYLRLQSH